MTDEWKLVINGKPAPLYYDAETTTAAAAAAGDVNWMKYSEVACDEARAELGRTGKTFGCRFVVQQIHWPIARSGLDCGGAGGRSSAVKHDELTFIFIKRCLSPAAAAILGALAGRREQYAAGQWKEEVWPWPEAPRSARYCHGISQTSERCRTLCWDEPRNWCKADRLLAARTMLCSAFNQRLLYPQMAVCRTAISKTLRYSASNNYQLNVCMID